MFLILYIFIILFQIAVYLARLLFIVVVNAAKLLFAFAKVTFQFVQLVVLGAVAAFFKIKEIVSDKLLERRIAKRNKQRTA